ncbi:hypothetical protein HPB50_003373 [Hyalomma asiaticum]|uniref:Uncharacterized protein n=1 Tax=Hyalomma asiaticum TaxID=266040 RepID=A0ACB7TEB7_HYAAI|nr:hypothetical protein HPB50_003373 [Hyalomma asiaticum]
MVSHAHRRNGPTGAHSGEAGLAELPPTGRPVGHKIHGRSPTLSPPPRSPSSREVRYRTGGALLGRTLLLLLLLHGRHSAVARVLHLRGPFLIRWRA